MTDEERRQAAEWALKAMPDLKKVKPVKMRADGRPSLRRCDMRPPRVCIPRAFEQDQWPQVLVHLREGGQALVVQYRPGCRWHVGKAGKPYLARLYDRNKKRLVKTAKEMGIFQRVVVHDPRRPYVRFEGTQLERAMAKAAEWSVV